MSSENGQKPPEPPALEDADPVATLKGRLSESEALVAHFRGEVEKRDQLLAEEQRQKYEGWGNEALAWRRREEALQMLGELRAKCVAYGIDPDAPIDLNPGVPNAAPDGGVPLAPAPDGR